MDLSAYDGNPETIEFSLLPYDVGGGLIDNRVGMTYPTCTTWLHCACGSYSIDRNWALDLPSLHVIELTTIPHRIRRREEEIHRFGEECLGALHSHQLCDGKVWF